MMEPGSTADPLGEALHSMRMSSSFYSRCEFTAPWGLELPAFRDYLMFHVVTSGRCRLEVAGAEPCLLQPGDLALVPHGEGHRLVSEPTAAAAKLFDLPHEHLSERYEIIRQGGGGALTTLLCGVIRFDQPAARHLVGVLPRMISVEAWSSPEQEWIQSTLRLMVAEARELRPGGETIITRLADILVIQAIRAWIARDPVARTGWLGALRDRQIGPAIGALHRDPARPWTVASLASQAAMSRSAFAARFTDLVGETPIHYVARWRMQVAQTLLQENEAAIGELAFRLGYRSEAAFSRAFKRFVGVPPGAVRRDPATAYGPHAATARQGAPPG
jgi:AraC-like DNA-binding protein